MEENKVTEPNGTPIDNGDGNGATPTGYDLADVVAAVGVDAILENADVKKAMLSRQDQKITQALNTARGKWEAEAKAKAEAEKDEATRLANMTAAEKERYQFEQEKKAFEAQKAEYTRKTLVLETSKQMLDEGLPDLADFVTGKDAETTAQNLTRFKEVLGAWKTQVLSDAMRGKTPKDMGVTQTVTREDLKNMTPAEINKLWESGALKNLK